MKKKLSALLKTEQVAGDARFNDLYHAYQAAKAALSQAKQVKEEAKKAHHQLLKDRRPDAHAAFESLSELRKTKYLHQYQRVELELAKHRLRRMIDELEEAPATPAAKTRKAPTAAKGAKDTTSGQRGRPAAKPRAKTLAPAKTPDQAPKRSSGSRKKKIA